MLVKAENYEDMIEIKGFVWDDSLTAYFFAWGAALFGFIIGLRSCEWHEIFASDHRLLQSFYRLLAVEIVVTLLICATPTIFPEWANFVDKAAFWCVAVIILSMAGIFFFFASWIMAKTIKWIIGV